MNRDELLRFIKDNKYDTCPECGNVKGNEIEIDLENPDGEVATVCCAECGIGWIIDRPEE